MSSERLWVGVDVGTQGVRVLVASGTGQLAGRGSAPLAGVRDGARHEQDPAHWWDAFGQAARQAMAGVDPAAVRGLALAATSGTVLLVDGRGEALTRGLMYDDTRAVGQAETATAAGRELWRRLGYHRMQPAWALPKLLWLLAHHPELVPGARLAHQSDYLTGKLAGRPVATDHSNALKTGCDLVGGGWPGEVMAALGVPDRLLPPLVRSGSPLGTVGRHAAMHTGLPAGLPIFAGTTDGCAAQLGAGVVDPGDWNSVLGTTLVLKGVSDRLVADPSGAVYSHRSPDGRWLPGGASSSGAGAIDRALPGRDLDRLAGSAADRLPTGVLSYPLASARGERFPFVLPDAEPFQLGRPRDDVERYAALMQGISFVERLCFDQLDRLGAAVTGRRVLTGGAARSPAWCQLRADVLGGPVCLTTPAEPGLGMAVLAAASEHGLPAAARAMVSVSSVYQPRPESTDRFTGPYLRFVDELRERRWLPAELATHAHRRARP